MTEATRTIISAAIRADATLTASAKSRLVRALTEEPRTDDGAPTRRFMTEKQAALVLGVSVPTISRMKRDGILKTRIVRNTTRITAESVYAI